MKTNTRLPSEPRNQRHFSGLLFEGKKKKEEKKKKSSGLLIAEECLSKLQPYQAQNVAREGGTRSPPEGGGEWGSGNGSGEGLPPQPPSPRLASSNLSRSSLSGVYLSRTLTLSCFKNTQQLTEAFLKIYLFIFTASCQQLPYKNLSSAF